MTTRLAETALPRPNLNVRHSRSPVARRPAPFSLRCGAMLIDYILLVGIVAFSTLIARMLGGGARSAGSSAQTVGLLIALVFAFLNLGLLPAVTGKTVGKWATGLQVQRTDGQVLGMGRALLRHFVGYPLSVLTLGFGFLLAALSTQGRALHDFLAGTVVVREGRVVQAHHRVEKAQKGAWDPRA